MNFIDTADVYSHGESEEIVGKAIVGRRDDVVLATKVHVPMGNDPNMWGNSRRWIQREVENSLRRLGTDWIDLYQVHRPDEAADVDDTLGAPERSGAPGEDPVRRIVDLPGRVHRRRRSGWRNAAVGSASGASSRPIRSSCAT